VPAVPEGAYNKESAGDPFKCQTTAVPLARYPVFRMHVPIDNTKGASESQESIIPTVEHPVIKEPFSEVPQSTAEIPTGFNENIFNDAEHSIKWLVVTNTWPKFVDSIGDSMSEVSTIHE